MPKVAFIDVDTQFDFMDPKGGLYVKGAQELVSNLSRLLGHAKARKIPVISTMDTHAKDDPEFKKFPPHCVKGTLGQAKIRETIMERARTVSNIKQEVNPLGWDQVLLEKNSLNMFENVNAEDILKYTGAKRFVVFGVATDYCVGLVARGLLMRGYKVDIVTDAIAAVDEEEGRKMLDELEEKGARLVTLENVLQDT